MRCLEEKVNANQLMRTKIKKKEEWFFQLISVEGAALLYISGRKLSGTLRLFFFVLRCDPVKLFINNSVDAMLASAI